VLRPPRQALPYEMAAGRSGVFLKNRDFLESDFRGIQWGSLSMSSVLFGLKRFGTDGDVLVVVLNDGVAEARGYEVRLLDGSVLCATSVSGREGGMVVEEPLLGKLSISADELFEVRRLRPGQSTASNSPAER
jgi:hypothetical protein